MIIPKETKEEDLEKYRLKLETELNEITWEIDRKMGVSKVEKGKKRKSRNEE